MLKEKMASSPFEELKTILRIDQMILEEGDFKQYHDSTLNISRKILGVVFPENVEEVIKVVKLANQIKFSLYPISTGNNWGYGSSHPNEDYALIVDLSRMNQILDFDQDLGIITIQPGVTQKILYEFLEKKGYQYFVPTTGAGPNCSIIGNALEKGYGIVPINDHFQAVNSLEAVMPTGEIYRSLLSEAGGTLVDKCFKWGVGAYLDGIFAQSNFGIVTQMTITLAPKPNSNEIFVISIPTEEQLEKAITLAQILLKNLNGHIGGINLMNDLRRIAMLEPYPEKNLKSGQKITEAWISQKRKQLNIPKWSIVGTLYGPKPVVKAYKKIIKKQFSSQFKIQFYSLNLVHKIIKFKKFFNWGPLKLFREFLEKNYENVKLLSGIPTESALKLSYWKQQKIVKGPLDPDRDQCGLLWFSPLVPMKSQEVTRFIQIINDVFKASSFEPLITLSSLSSQCFDSTIPILFKINEQKPKADQLWADLYQACKKEGFFPYRLDIENQKKLINESPQFFEIHGKIKKALDPQFLLSPKRYSRY